MKKYEQDELIELNYKGKIFNCRITDNDDPISTIRGIEKMSKFS